MKPCNYVIIIKQLKMDKLLYTFEPVKSGFNFTIWVALILMACAVAGMVFLLKKKSTEISYNMRMLGAMLLFFVAIISASTAFFSFWASSRTTTVKIYKKSVETDRGRVTFKNLKGAYINADKGSSGGLMPSTKRDTTKLLIIEEKTGRTHVLSSYNYNVMKIVRLLQPMIKKANQ